MSTKDDDPNIRKVVTLRESVWREISKYQSMERITTQTEAVRRLLEDALKAAARKVTAQRIHQSTLKGQATRERQKRK